MRWILIDLALALVALSLLAVLGLRLWRQAKAFSVTVAKASAQVAGVTGALEAAQAQGALGKGAAPHDVAGRSSGGPGRNKPGPRSGA